ncbi:MAG TPA: efflux RND transporter periplasmic adaptor subunit [Casimicrobiaceae bacterium]|nr:efflux RND transporter periplasmic adaptor subunit [Casimicrobiaceae bacterium]
MSLPSLSSLRDTLADGPRGLRARRAVLAVAAVAVVAYLFRDTLFGMPVFVQEVARGDLIETVVASGRVMTPQRASVASVVTEVVARIPVEEGQTVKRGDVLIELDSRDERAALAQAQAALAQAEAKLRQIQEVGLPSAKQAQVQAEANARLAQAQFERNRDLKAQGYISQSALDDATRNLDVAASQLDAARLQVQTNTQGGADFEMAQTALEQARAGLVVAKSRLDQTVIVAPADGVLIARDVEVGDVTQPGKELMVLAPIGETQIEVQVDEKNLARLAIGQKAFASADAYPRERFKAELFYINPGIDALRGSVQVKLRVSEPPPYLRQDMTVSVDIEVARRPATLIAAADAVFDVASTHPWVLVVENHRASRRPVVVGARGEGQVEILEGVAPGDRLIPAAANAAPGQRVRVASGRPPSS